LIKMKKNALNFYFEFTVKNFIFSFKNNNSQLKKIYFFSVTNLLISGISGMHKKIT